MTTRTPNAPLARRDPPQARTRHGRSIGIEPDLSQIPDFEIVPRRLLLVAGIIVAALIASVESGERWVIEILHVGSGGLWTTIDLFVGFVIGPIIARCSPHARIELTVRLMPKMLVIMPIVVTATLVSGWQLGIATGSVDSEHYLHGWIVASYVAVGVILVCAQLLLQPANLAVLFELKRPEPRLDVIARLMGRFTQTTAVIGVMQVAIILIMTRVAVG